MKIISTDASLLEIPQASWLTNVEDRQLGHHWNLIHVPVAPREVPHFGFLGLEARLPQPFEEDGVDSNQAGQRRRQHVCFDQAGDVTWINMQWSLIQSERYD